MKKTSNVNPVKYSPKTFIYCVNNTGINVRCKGAATKGTMARGPMA